MTFIHPLLLGGLLLIGVPVLIHLITQQKPKHLLFPAFRFLVQRHRENQRRLKVRHLLLLLLRITLIALICLALARPKVFNDRIAAVTGQPIAVALVFDTSPSMEYLQGGQSRLAETKQRALELLDELPADSRVAVFDTADDVSGHWQESSDLVRKSVADLQIRYANHPVTDVLEHAYRLLGQSDDDRMGTDPLPRFLYVFSDRTRDSWDERRLSQLMEMRNRTEPRVQAIYVDVGVEQPKNLAITELKLPRQAVSANQPFVLSARVQATGRAYDTTLLCRFDDEKDAERRPIKLSQGQQVLIGPFKRETLKAGLHRVEVSLETPDNLPFSAVQFATFEVRGPREVLTICDEPGAEAKSDKPNEIEANPGDAAFWKLALDTHGQFHCKVVSTRDAEKLDLNELRKYQAICLLDVARPDAELWDKLGRYVQLIGGGLAIIPGGQELDRAAYDTDAARQLMPARLLEPVEDKQGATWRIENFHHGLMAPFREWGIAANVNFIKVPRRAFRYWTVADVKQDGRGDVIVPYAVKDSPPALLERKLPKEVHGRVLLFTTTLDGRRSWNDYLELGGAFYLALANKTIGYLSGDSDEVQLNFVTGQTVMVALPAQPRFPTYTLQPPGNGPAVVLPLADKENELKLTPEQVAQPGSYTLLGGKAVWRGGFSLNVPEGECQLDRVPAEKIEQLFGAKSVLAVGPGVTLPSAVQGQWSQPVELFPWLMILLLLVLAVENLLANRFYRREPPVVEKEPAGN